jgi:hypothetical protein
MTPFTIVLDGQALRGPARVGDEGVVLEPAATWNALALPVGHEADLAEVAARLDRPLAVDREEHAAFLGVSARTRAERLRSLQAPDFALPDLDGRLHTLGEHRGAKVFLVAYASW